MIEFPIAEMKLTAMLVPMAVAVGVVVSAILWIADRRDTRIGKADGNTGTGS